MLAGRTYQRAPKWAYLYWYWERYPVLVVFYVLGGLAALFLLLRRRPEAGAGVVVAVTAVVLAVAHRSHIIGPEYLSHALPLLTVLGGLLLMAVGRIHPLAGAAVGALRCRDPDDAGPAPTGGDGPALAASSLARRGGVPGAALETGATGSWRRSTASSRAGTWLTPGARGPWRPTSRRCPPGTPRSSSSGEVALWGGFRYVAVGNSFSDWTDLDNRIRLLLQKWPVVWKSEEGGAGSSRLIIYQLPARADRRKPLPVARP